ncbi:uncharacterized protein K444DRAFT_282816 [Hyaloscypha bicolor E]|uniref:Uncharacterized protein n=1 Tax=Hyaloscypha bicolor E TaxID=1095630 RepID=A0A2J6SG84_9HELO|nr:uncharacterized protein K444DRAFT_282816 [Hyaloscypha bicolor E]PMD49764.1 hypothetical protein K444DRAFT_282816 [Hyaloscypha bicolor E]
MLKCRPEHRGVRASAPILLVVPESTDKVNIPFGYHPKTPNSLGKLLICLPRTHQGGKWEIIERHTEASTTFECTSSNLNHIQWAACFGSCQYSIYTVQGSHQLIFLYNLEVSERVGCLLRRPEPGQGLLAMPSCFPLYASIKHMLQNPGFMKEGGKLGFYCRYPYLHTKPKTQNLMPYELKGIDIILSIASFALVVLKR